MHFCVTSYPRILDWFCGAHAGELGSVCLVLGLILCVLTRASLCWGCVYVLLECLSRLFWVWMSVPLRAFGKTGVC